MGKWTSDEIRNTVLAIVARRLGLEPDDIGLDAELIDKLGAESLDILYIVAELEKQFSLSIPDEVLPTVKTSRQIITRLEEELLAR